MKKKPLRFFFLFLWLFFLLLGTSRPDALTLRDEVGRTVSFSFPPKRIVSLAPNITEILFALGLDEEIVGVSIHCNYPEKARRKVPVGSYIRLDYERIVHLNPDLVIATGAGNTREMVDRLEKLGFCTFVIFPKKLDAILQSIGLLGQVTGRQGEASLITNEMKRRRQRVIELTQGRARPKTFLQIGEAPVVTVGRGSFGNDLIRLAGGENVAGNEKERYPRLGIEEILRRAPEVILVSSMNPKRDFAKGIEEWSQWKTIPAVEKGRVHLIDSDLIDRPSPRIIDGLEEIARFLHPERFKR